MRAQQDSGYSTEPTLRQVKIAGNLARNPPVSPDKIDERRTLTANRPMGGNRNNRACCRQAARPTASRAVVRRLAAALASALLAVPAPAGAQVADPSGGCALTILTSYPESFYAPFLGRFSQETGTAACVINKNTISILDHMRETRQPAPDLIWSSSPIAFRMLDDEGLLARLPEKVRPPAEFGGLAVDARDGSRFGFALSQVGVMWAPPTQLPAPGTLQDLADPGLAGQIGMTSPARSGTTHLFVEAILQQHGWQDGWALISRLGGNLATVTARSFGVPEGVRRDRFAFGIGIDFLATVGRPPDERLRFRPLSPKIFTASVAATPEGAANPRAAAFIDFLRSPGAQELLVGPSIARIPVLPSLWPKAGFVPRPEPDGGTFDEGLAARRLAVVTALFDEMVTYRQVELGRLWEDTRRLERLAGSGASPVATRYLHQIRGLLESVPVAPFMADLDLLEPLSTGSEFRALDGRLRIQDSWARDFGSRFDRARELLAQLDALVAATPEKQAP